MNTLKDPQKATPWDVHVKTAEYLDRAEGAQFTAHNQTAWTQNGAQTRDPAWHIPMKHTTKTKQKTYQLSWNNIVWRKQWITVICLSVAICVVTTTHKLNMHVLTAEKQRTFYGDLTTRAEITANKRPSTCTSHTHTYTHHSRISTGAGLLLP